MLNFLKKLLFDTPYWEEPVYVLQDHKDKRYVALRKRLDSKNIKTSDNRLELFQDRYTAQFWLIQYSDQGSGSYNSESLVPIETTLGEQLIATPKLIEEYIPPTLKVPNIKYAER